MWNGVDRREHIGLETLRALTMNLVERDTETKQDLEKFQTIADKLPVGVWYCNSSGFSYYVNDTWAKWVGMPKVDCLGKGWIHGLAIEDRELSWTIWQEAVHHSDKYKANYRLINNSNGKERKCFAFGKKLGNDYWLGITIDLDEIGEHFYGAK
jgi:PAS domain S-box-containing protein